jgi:hypothetical protein
MKQQNFDLSQKQTAGGRRLWNGVHDLTSYHICDIDSTFMSCLLIQLASILTFDMTCSSYKESTPLDLSPEAEGTFGIGAHD